MQCRLIIAKFLLMSVFLSGGSRMMADTKDEGVKTRDQIPLQYKWNLEEIYSNKINWEKDFSKIEKEMIPALTAFKGKLTNAETVLKCFRLSDDASRLMEKVFVYIHLKADENQTDNDVLEMSSRSETLSTKLGTASAFIRPEILAQEESVIQSYMKDSAFEDYRHSLDALLKVKAHTLSRPEEELLALSSDVAGVPSDAYNKLRLADMTYPKIKDDKGKDVQLSPAVYQMILENKDRAFRKRAFEGMYRSYDKSKNTFAALLNGEVKKDAFYSQARKYSSSLEAALSGGFIPRKVYDNLIESVNSNLQVLHQYVTLRKKILKLDKVHLYDMYLPLVDSVDFKINYEDAKKMILEGLKPLGEAYLKDVRKGFEGRWIDVYETKNKNTGGYNWGSYDTHPYILMNYNDTVDSMLTLAHEMGHAMNSYYSDKAQKYPNAGYSIFTAEVASTANENLMLKYLIEHAKNDQEKLFFLNQVAENIRGTIFTQVMYSEFEKAIHERVERGEALSAKSLGEMWKDLMTRYYGPDFVSDELAPLWWSRVPHFYMNFYVYKYATSLAASYDLVKQMSGGKSPELARKKYLEFLAAGGSDYPVAVLKKAGVDMESPEPVNTILAEFASLLTEMEKILRKMGKM
jgi:oligoendopeptidase F